MHLIRVGGAAVNQTPLDWDGNRDRIGAAIAAARAAGVSILCLPELCISGYGCEDAFLSPGVQRMAWRVLGEILPQTAGMAVAAAQLRLSREDRAALWGTYVPWAARAGGRCADLVAIYYELHLEEALDDVRRRWRVEVAPQGPFEEAEARARREREERRRRRDQGQE